MYTKIKIKFSKYLQIYKKEINRFEILYENTSEYSNGNLIDFEVITHRKMIGPPKVYIVVFVGQRISNHTYKYYTIL